MGLARSFVGVNPANTKEEKGCCFTGKFFWGEKTLPDKQGGSEDYGEPPGTAPFN